MKKFAILGAIAAVATAGGVFAAWTFTEAKEYQDVDETISITVDNEVINQGYGDVSVNSTYALSLAGDGVSNNNKIEITEDGDIEINYAPVEKDQGVTMTVSFTGIDGTYISVGYTGQTSVNLGTENTTYTITDQMIDVTAKKEIKSSTDLTALQAEVAAGIKFTFTFTANTPSNNN